MQLSRYLFRGVQSEKRRLGRTHEEYNIYRQRWRERERKSLRVKKGWTQGPEENLRVGKYPVNWIQQQAGSGEFSRSKRVKVSSEL